jgi:hypothetical protein
MEAGSARLHAVPEVDGKSSVGKVEEEPSFRGEGSEQLGHIAAPQLVAVRERPNPVMTAPFFRDTDVLQDARGDDDIEEAARERQKCTVRDDEPVAPLALQPLPLAQGREIVSPRFDPLPLENVYLFSVSAAGI